jgi:hypothetical protein
MQVCPAENTLSCRCTKDMDTILHSADTSYYPKAGFFRWGRRIFNVSRWDKILGRHFWETVIHPVEGVCERAVFVDRAYRTVCLSVRINTPVTAEDPFGGHVGIMLPILEPSHDGTAAVLMVHIWRLQRTVLAHLRRKYVARVLAVGMGWHGRLGEHSPFAALPPELLSAMI